MIDSPARRHAVGLALLALGAAGLVAAALLRGANPDAAWAAALDTRSWLGIPNAGDVLTNLPFLPAGLMGLLFARRQHAPGPVFASSAERSAWLAFFAFVLVTGFTSGWFHLAPSADRLCFDRLTLVIACEAVFCAVLAERVSARAGAALLPLLSLGAAAATFWWWWTQRQGAADLRWYAAAQLLPIAALVLVLALTSSRDAGLGLWWLIVFYGAAKLAEMLDQPILSTNGVVSGHACKHLLAAAAAWSAYLVLRRRLSPGGATAPVASSDPRARAVPPAPRP